MFRKNFFTPKYIVAFICVVCILILIGVYFFTRETPKERQIFEDLAIMDMIGGLVNIPSEKPIIATINQADIVAGSKPFYAGAQDGDKLIIFPKSEQAIIYSPARNTIVNSGPFKIGATISQ